MMFNNRKFLKALSVTVAICVAFTMSISVSAQSREHGKPSSNSSSVQKPDAPERVNGATEKTVATAYLIEKGIIKGNANGQYTMVSKIKRGDFIIMLVRAFKLSAKDKGCFKDVLKRSYYYDAVAIAKALGIALGDGTGYFKAEKYVTVQEAMLLIERAMKIAGSSVTVAANVSLKTAFASLTLTSYATREQVAEMLYYVLTGKTDGAALVTPATTTTGSAVTGTGKYTLTGGTDTLTGGALIATDSGVSAMLVKSAGNLTVSGYTITKTGNTKSTDNSDFYGVNAAVLAESAGVIAISGTTVTTNAKGANALFATGANSKITAKNVTIITSADSSRGLDATYAGTIVADVLNITTAGAHSAAVATDRGSGSVTVTNSTLKTTGTDSPVIYSTGNIQLTGTTGTASGSEAAVVEGKNSITLLNTILFAAKKSGVMLYQSTSGDAATGTASFGMTGGSLTAAEGPLFYVTNTAAAVNLSGATLSSSSGILLKASADKWGKSSSNGGVVSFTANAQKLPGNVVCDSKSTVAMTLNNASTLTGAVNSAKSGGTVALTLDATSKWVVTGTSYLTSLADADTTFANIDDNGYTVYYNSSSSANAYLKGMTYTLKDGGKLQPIAG